jgi:L-asparagine oxygenase
MGTLSQVEAFRTASNRSGALLIRDVPIGVIGKTPSTPTEQGTKDSTSEESLLAMARLLGEPVGYLPELGGRIVQNLVPVVSNATVQTSTSSKATLMWHTETAFHPHKPRYLALLCLRGQVGAHTLLCSIDDLLTTLPAKIVDVLQQPRFRVSPDRSFLAEGSAGTLGPAIAVLAKTSGGEEFTFDADLMVGIDQDASAALVTLSEHIEHHVQRIELAAGDLLVIDNHRAVHGRSSFTARFDGTDRWLQRAFIVESLETSVKDRVGRIITTRF